MVLSGEIYDELYKHFFLNAQELARSGLKHRVLYVNK